MRYVHLHNTALRVSVVALGTGPFASYVDGNTATDILDAFVGEGGNFIDTANVYGRWNPGNLPLCERLIGKWLKHHHLRDKIIIATKGAADAIAQPHVRRLSPQEIRSDIEDSLTNLGTDYIDLYYLHQDDPERPVGEILETMNSLYQEGKMRYFGCSNWSGARMAEADAYAENHHLEGFAAHEIMFNLARSNPKVVYDEIQVCTDEEIWNYHRDTQKPMIAYTSQAAGIFARWHASDFFEGDKHAFPRRFFWNSVTEKRLQKVDQLSAMTGRSPSEIALGFHFAQPFQVVPIIGPYNTAELYDSLKSSNYIMTPEELNFILDGEDFWTAETDQK